jgi:hypothetical protein
MPSECELRFRGRPSRRNRWRASGKPETGQEGLNHLRLADHSKDLTPALAADMFQNIEFENTAHQVCPWQGSSSKRREAVAPWRPASEAACVEGGGSALHSARSRTTVARHLAPGARTP